MRLAAAEPPSNVCSGWAARDVAIVYVLAGCGLRAAECCNARIRDLDLHLDRPVLHVRHGSKGGKRRDVPVPRAAVASSERWLAERAARFAKLPGPSERLFVRNHGAPLDDAWLDRLVRRLAHQRSVTLREQVAAHGFRHHYGSQLALRPFPRPSSRS